MSDSVMPKLLSVCIASYGDDVGKLVQELRLCTSYGLAADWSIEILVSDQFESPHPEAQNWGITYFHRPNNGGRSENRNFLARESTGSHLLFLDADALPKYPSFLLNYTKLLEREMCVVGGTAYMPGHQLNALRVKVGRAKEELPARVRRKYPHRSFSAFNFAIDRSTFLSIGFDERLKTYGHEDTLFGQQLRYRVIPILHIDNPAYHMGIDGDADFVEKTQVAVDGLVRLVHLGLIDEEVRLFRMYKALHKYGIAQALKPFAKSWGLGLKKHLSKGGGPLFLFDLFKVLRICELGPALVSKPD